VLDAAADDCGCAWPNGEPFIQFDYEPHRAADGEAEVRVTRTR
jgi:hypothetical protein